MLACAHLDSACEWREEMENINAAYFLILMDSIWINPVVSVGSKPPSSSIEDSCSSYKPYKPKNNQPQQTLNPQKRKEQTSLLLLPSTTTFPLYNFNLTNPLT